MLTATNEKSDTDAQLQERLARFIEAATVSETYTSQESAEFISRLNAGLTHAQRMQLNKEIMNPETIAAIKARIRQRQIAGGITPRP